MDPVCRRCHNPSMGNTPSRDAVVPAAPAVGATARIQTSSTSARCLLWRGLLVAAVGIGTTVRAQADGRDPDAIAREVLAKLSPEAKAGQLFMSWILSREEGQAENRAQMERHVRDVGLGGVILSLGERAEALALVERLQAAAEVPLLMAGDFENGLSFRFGDATDLGPNMLVGAAGRSDLAHAAGRHTGRGARLLGFHWAFAPVLDVNNNPANPIINVRSYGADPALVSRLGAAFVRGVQGEGVLACGKHFPGHGNVATDSHLSMATVPGTRDELFATELHPFAVAIEAGLGGIMSGHLAVPGLGVAADVPATLAPEILTGVLREQLGFEGIVVTDALDMGGVRNALAPGEVAVRALLAGADMLLMPPDPVQARDAVLAAVASGRLPQARVDDAVFRILRAKARFGALDGRGDQPPAIERAAMAGRDPELARSIAEAGVTLVRDQQGRVPLVAAGAVTVVDLLDGERKGGSGVASALRAAGLEVAHHRVTAESSGTAIAEAAAAVRSAATVVVNLHVKVRAFSGTIAVPESLQPVVGELTGRPDAIVASFGNPYLLSRFPAVGTYLCAYGTTPATEAAVGGVLTGAVMPRGRLPVSIPGLVELGTGVQRWRAADGARADSESTGIDPELGERLTKRLQQAVADRVFPGAVCLVTRRGARVCEIAVGQATYADDAAPVRRDSVFDMASLTKVCATAPAVMTLVRDGVVELDQRVATLLPGFTGGGREAVTLRHLLTHSSGLPAWRGFYAEASSREHVVRLALATELEVAPGERVRYSDIGLILLMACVEAATGTDFDHAVQRRVFDPLGMAGARFNTTAAPLPGAVPTEVVEQRGGLVRGVVHDENAWAMGGISGHAGLFATAGDVASLGHAFLNGGRGPAGAWLPAGLVEEAIRPAGVPEGSRRCLGWDHPGPGAWAGTHPPPRLFAHTGFTGTSVWCDPDTALCVVLLTNRVHPTRQERRHTAVRREIHDLVQGAVLR